MVAKKGNVQAHHFAHRAQQDGRSCASAGETALHKFAKKILDERLEIALPAMLVVEYGDRESVVQAETRAFDRAILEAKAGQIVPDVMLLLRDRRLIVEFKVTHSCDEEKLARIQMMDVGAIEIDLSQYRDHPLNRSAIKSSTMRPEYGYITHARVSRANALRIPANITEVHDRASLSDDRQAL
ncbi:MULTISPECIES: hypothetical protein [unclassified Bradyrhizobium]|uniref:hypothetical protein n=1 Tax=unclassified Bradyrhizobium TaxID=2631580 RepID=UPI001FF72CDA|nr:MULTISPECIES: hypothetical protein [unclassified Bradyrhizobium]